MNKKMIELKAMFYALPLYKQILAVISAILHNLKNKIKKRFVK